MNRIIQKEATECFKKRDIARLSVKAAKHSRGKRKSRMDAYKLRSEDFRLNSKQHTRLPPLLPERLMQ